MYLSRIVLTICGVLICGVNSQEELITKCPEFFEYDTSKTETSKWFGELILSSEFILTGFWVELNLSNVADVFGIKSDIPLITKDNKNYVLVSRTDKLEPGKPIKIPVFVKYDELNFPIPEIVSIRINGRKVCPTQSPPPVGISPCPGIFSYDPDQQEGSEKWFGAIALNLEYDLQGLFLEFHLTGKADLIGAYNYRIKFPNNQELNYWSSVGDIVSPDNRIYSLSNSSFVLKHGHLLTIPFFVKYNEIESIPLVKTVVVNGRIICESSSKNFIPQIPLGVIPENLGSGAAARSQTTPPSIDSLFSTTSRTFSSLIPEVPEVEDEDYEWKRDGYQCGVAEITDKVIGGAVTTIRKHPWHGAIFREGKYNCGMTLISRKHAISAAHCFYLKAVYNIDKSKLSFRFGIDNIKGELRKDAQIAKLSNVKLHENYFYHITKYDIAIISFSEELRITDTVTPVCLWSGDATQHQIENKVGTIVGFGITEDDQISENLREAKILVVDLETCREKAPIFYAQHLTTNSFCAGNISSGIGSCGGDSGGGLFFKKAGSEIWEVRGVTSTSRQAQTSCDTSVYVIYTDVAKFKHWILETMEH